MSQNENKMKQLDLAFQIPVIADALSANPLVYVDVGAAVGVEEPWRSLLRAEALTRVVGFEPHPENIKGIERLANGTYHQVAIGEAPGRATFYLHSTYSSLIDRSDEFGSQMPTMVVDVETLGRLRSAGAIPSLDIVKTDTELADYQAVASCGPYLDEEVLCAQCEFSFSGSLPEHPFRDFDALLQSKGFLLYGLSTQIGALGEIQGGNLLYVRSIFDLLSHGDAAIQRVRGIKLFMIALTLSHLDLAYMISRALEDRGVVTRDEAAALQKVATHFVYVPDTLPFSGWRANAASMLGNLTAVVGGGFTRAVSTPSSNRMENYRRLIRSPNIFWRREKMRSLYEHYYLDAARRAGLSAKPAKSG